MAFNHDCSCIAVEIYRPAENKPESPKCTFSLRRFKICQRFKVLALPNVSRTLLTECQDHNKFHEEFDNN